MPRGTIQQQHGMRAPLHGTGDLVEMALHGLGVGMRHGQRRAGASRRADGAEQVGVLVALVGGLGRPRPAPCPLPDETVLLAKPHLILDQISTALLFAMWAMYAFSAARLPFD